MSDSRHYVPRSSRGFYRLLRHTYGAWLKRTYRVESQGGEVFDGLRAPYVIVGNHQTTRDPFILSLYTRHPIYWVTSDGNMRSRLMRYLLSWVGSIPKSKAIPDRKTIDWIVKVVRKRRGVIGIFPEGQQSWDGTTLPLQPATAKLLKLLKVPVVAARLEGAYLSLPRWTWSRRKGRMRVVWRLLLTPEELESLDTDEILARLEKGLAWDEYAWQERHRQAFIGPRRAEHVELALYQCPECGAIGRLRSKGKRLHCAACGATFVLDRYGYFGMAGKGEARFPSIRDWSRWQEGAFREAAEAALGRPGRPFISDSGALLYRGHRMNPLRRIRTGTLVLYPDRLELATLLGERLSFPVSEIDGIGVLKRNLLEFYVGQALYQVRFTRRSVSARKWADGLGFFSARKRAVGDAGAAVRN